MMTHTDEDGRREAQALLEGLRGRGLAVELVNGQLHVSPAGRLTDGDRDEIRRLKGRIVQTLEALSQEVGPGASAPDGGAGDTGTGPAEWDAAAADAALGAAEARLDKALASGEANTDARRAVAEVCRGVAREHHRNRHPLPWDVPAWVERLLGRWREPEPSASDWEPEEV